MDVLLSLLMLNVKPSDGLRAGFVDVSAFLPEMWLSAFVLTFFLQVLETSPCREGAAEIFNFSLHSLHFYLVTHVQYLLFVQRTSGAASNQVEGSPASQVGPSATGPSPGSHAGAQSP